jgi:hypothetical protein
VITIECPNCSDLVELPPIAKGPKLLLFEPLGICWCSGCDSELTLFAERTIRKTIEFRLVDPNAIWSPEEIMRQEG